MTMPAECDTVWMMLELY